MTDGPSLPALHLLADLHVDVDGVQAHVSGDGQELVVETETPLRLARAAQRSLPPGTPGSRATTAVVGDLLAAQGVTVRLHGPHGTVGTIGAAVDSPIGSVLAGSRRVQVSVPARLPRLGAVAVAIFVLARTLRNRRG